VICNNHVYVDLIVELLPTKICDMICVLKKYVQICFTSLSNHYHFILDYLEILFFGKITRFQKHFCFTEFFFLSIIWKNLKISLKKETKHAYSLGLIEIIKQNLYQDKFTKVCSLWRYKLNYYLLKILNYYKILF